MESFTSTSDLEYLGRYVIRNVTDDIVYEFLHSMLDCVIERWDPILIDENVYIPEESKSIFSDTSLRKNENENNGDDNHSVTSRSQKKISPQNVKVQLKNGCLYEGCISNWMMDGYGRYRWTDGSIYEGMFANNEIQGIGKMKWPDLCWYEGQFLHGRRHGFGTFSIANSNTCYRGEWWFSKKHGKGRLIYDENQYYDGEWHEDEYDGKGKRVYDCKTWYYGSWHRGKRQGYGRMCWSNNDFYKGEWINGLMHGYGKYTWDGELFSEFVFHLDNTYKGMWKNGERDGFGTLFFGHLNGAMYEGQFHRNFKHGEGSIICGNGKIIYSQPLFQYDNPFHVFSNDETGPKSKFVDRIPKDQMVTFNPKKTFNNKLVCDCEDCCCDPKILHERDRVLYCLQNTINIPIHEPVHRIDLSYHLLKISVKNIIQKDELHHILKRTKVMNEHYQKSFPAEKSLISMTETKEPHYLIKISPMKNPLDDERPILLRDPDEIVREEHFIYNCFILHLPRLWEIYRFYCNICCQDYYYENFLAEKKYRRVMIRLFLWQMYRDCNIITKLSLVKTDILLARNKAALMKSIHNPFERIYFFQFLHSLLAVAWELYGENIDARIFGGSLLASALHKFLQDDIYQNIQLYKHSGVVLLKYRELAPLKSMYEFYRSVAEPISVRQFIQLFIPSKINKRETILQNISARKFTMYAGINAMVLNSKSYAPRNDILWGIIDDEKCNELFEYENGSKMNTTLPRSFDILEVIDSLSVISPLIFTETLLNIEYKMTFLEFYEALIACLVRSFGVKLIKEKAAKDLLQEKTSSVIVKRISKKFKDRSNVFNMSSSMLDYGSKSKLFHPRSASVSKSKLTNVSKIVIKNYSTRTVHEPSKYKF